MTDIFAKNLNNYQLRDNSRHQNDLINQESKAFTYGECSLRVLGPKIWNALPTEMKDSASLVVFKNLIKTWDGPSCECKLCNSINPVLET